MEAESDASITERVRRGAATAATGFAILKDLQNSRRFYSNALTENESKYFWNESLRILGKYLVDEEFNWLRYAVFGTQRQLPTFDDLSEEAEDVLAEFQAVALAPLLSKSFRTEGNVEKHVNQLQSSWMELKELDAKNLSQEFSRTCHAKCIFPDASALGGTLPIERVAYILNRCEEYVLRLVTHAYMAKMQRCPDPLTHLLILLKTRIDRCKDVFPELMSNDSPTEWFLEVLMSRDYARFGEESHWAQQVHKMEVSIETRRMTYSTIPPNLTSAESTFFGKAEMTVCDFETDVRSNNLKFQSHLKRLKDTNKSANEEPELFAATLISEIRMAELASWQAAKSMIYPSTQSVEPTSEPKSLTAKEQKLRKAHEYIRSKGPVCGASIAMFIGVEEPTFRKHYVPELKSRGVKHDGAGGDGYYVPTDSK